MDSYTAPPTEPPNSITVTVSLYTIANRLVAGSMAGRRVRIVLEAHHNAAILKARPQLGPHMDDFAGRKVISLDVCRAKEQSCSAEAALRNGHRRASIVRRRRRVEAS